MMAPDVSQLYTLGVPGLVVVVLVLSGVIVFLYRKADAKDDRIDAIQEQRLSDAKETRDRLTGPMEEQAKLSEKIYEILLSIRDKK
jgi:hypothetical protein